MNGAVIVAGGVGSRFGAPAGKQLTSAAGRPVVSHALAAFEACQAADVVVLVTHPDRAEEYRDAAVVPFGFAKVIAVVPGGERRQDSVAAGLEALPPDARTVAIHDGARPLVLPETIDRAFAVLAADPELQGVVVGHPVVDTLKETDCDGAVVATPDRAPLWSAQTPQVFPTAVLRDALAAARVDGFTGTDDASLVSRYGGRVVMIEGSRENTKVTVAEDLEFVTWVLERRATEGERA